MIRARDCSIPVTDLPHYAAVGTLFSQNFTPLGGVPFILKKYCGEVFYGLISNAVYHVQALYDRSPHSAVRFSVS